MDTLLNLWHALHQMVEPDQLNDLAGSLGPWMYAILFAIIFIETGLVVMPFLPGDSLLFAVGAVGAIEHSPINLPLVATLLIVAAVVGDALNYLIGSWVGPRVFASESSWLLNKKHLLEAQRFYEKHGNKTIILARFVPIVRTFAPFVAGIGRMNYARFAAYNVIGGTLWVLLFLGAGWLFGNVPVVKRNFQVVIYAIIVISVLPAGIEVLRTRLAARRGRSALVEATTLGAKPVGPDDRSPEGSEAILDRLG